MECQCCAQLVAQDVLICLRNRGIEQITGRVVEADRRLIRSGIAGLAQGGRNGSWVGNCLINDQVGDGADRRIHNTFGVDARRIGLGIGGVVAVVGNVGDTRARI